jgi:RNA polymerase sporulation-specific sigma factor
MKSFPKPLTAEEEKYYLQKMNSGDKAARDMLIERNQRLVAHIAKKYYSENRDHEDLISIGTVGLIKAVQSYNPEKGNRLVTYASKCIENELLMMLRGEKKRSRDVYLEEPIGTDKEGNSISLIDVIVTDEMDVPARLEKEEDLMRVTRYVESELSGREKEVILCRFGLQGRKPMTQMKVGKEMGISRSYVSRIEKGALEKLKRAFEKQK